MNKKYIDNNWLLDRDTEHVTAVTLQTIATEIKSLLKKHNISRLQIAEAIGRSPAAVSLFNSNIKKLNPNMTIGTLAVYLYTAITLAGKEVDAVKIPVSDIIFLRDMSKQATVEKMIEMRKEKCRKYLFAEAFNYGKNLTKSNMASQLRVLEDVKWKDDPHVSRISTYVRYALILGVTHIIVPVEDIKKLIASDRYRNGGLASKKNREGKGA